MKYGEIIEQLRRIAAGDAENDPDSLPSQLRYLAAEQEANNNQQE